MLAHPPSACKELTMPRVSHEILRWGRETAGLSESEAVDKLGIGDARGCFRCRSARERWKRVRWSLDGRFY